MAIDFGDIAARYAQARWDQATQPFTDPEAYMNNRMMQNYGVDLNGNTKPKSTTIQYGDNGRPETVTTKHEVGTPTQDYSIGANYSLTPQMPISSQGMQMPAAPAVGMQMPQQPVVQQPTPVAPQPQAMPNETAAETQRLMQQNATAQGVPTAISPEQLAQPVQVPQLPQPGPGVQVAGPMVAGAVPTAPVTGQNVRTAPGMTVNAVPPGEIPTNVAPAPAPHPMAQALSQLQEIQNDPAKLAAYYGNEGNKPEARQLAAALYKDHIKTEDARAKAENDLKTGVATGNWLPIMREIKSKKEEGSYLKAILFARLGLNDLAKEEQQKLGAGMSWQPMVGPNGERAFIKVDADGLPQKGLNENGLELTPKELSAFAAGASPIKGLTTHTQAFKDRNTGELYWQRSNGQLVNNRGVQFTGNTRDLFAYGIGSDITTKHEIALDQLRIKLEGVKASQRIQTLEDVNKKRQAEGLTPFSTSDIGLNTQGEFTTSVPSKVTPTPAVTVSAGGTPAATTTMPAATTTMPAGGSVAEVTRQRETAQQNIQDLNKANRVYGNELATGRQTAMQQNAVISRLQTAIDRNPNFWGIDTNSPAWRAFVDVNSSNENKAEALNTLARNMNIPADKRADFDQTMNDYRALQVNAITGSGLTASQTNTERESQRVMGTVGSISDRPAAAKATLEYAKAKIEYADAKARAWVAARKKNPTLDRAEFEIDFDDTQGEKIFKDANERIAKILKSGGATGAGSATGGTPQEGQRSKSKTGRDIIWRNGQWEYL